MKEVLFTMCLLTVAVLGCRSSNKDYASKVSLGAAGIASSFPTINIRGFCLVEHFAVGAQAGRMIVMWENDDGTGTGVLTWVPEESMGGKEEIRWDIAKESWVSMFDRITDQSILKEISHNMYESSRFEYAGLDGSFFMFTCFKDGHINSFAVNTASTYWSSTVPESIIIDCIDWPITLDYPPKGCLRASSRVFDKKGAKIAEAWRDYQYKAGGANKGWTPMKESPCLEQN